MEILTIIWFIFFAIATLIMVKNRMFSRKEKIQSVCAIVAMYAIMLVVGWLVVGKWV